jgi:hypothetical protein
VHSHHYFPVGSMQVQLSEQVSAPCFHGEAIGRYKDSAWRGCRQLSSRAYCLNISASSAPFSVHIRSADSDKTQRCNEQTTKASEEDGQEGEEVWGSRETHGDDLIGRGGPEATPTACQTFHTRGSLFIHLSWLNTAVLVDLACYGHTIER